jgi:hypothetical protein
MPQAARRPPVLRIAASTMPLASPSARITWLGNMIGIPLGDHVIIGRDRYISFKEEGWL